LVEGKKIHVDSSLIEAHASKDAGRKSGPELIAVYKRIVSAQETKLEDTVRPENYVAVNDTHVCTTDPDAALVSRRGQGSRARSHHHRALDDAHGVITAVETTSGSIAENHKLLELVEPHEANTQKEVHIVVGDSKYGTADNLAACVEKNRAPHLGLLADQAKRHRARAGCFDLSQFTYEATRDIYRCPAGQTLTRRRYHERRRRPEYTAAAGVCAACPLREQCSTGKERTVPRHEQIARSAPARRDRRRATSDGREFWPRGQRTRVQALALAALVAATDPRLADRGGAERETAAAHGNKNRPERSRGGAGQFHHRTFRNLP
jgi:hypothetical protein